MKSICYYFACVFSWILIVFLFAMIRSFLLSDIDFWYSLGENIVNISLWVVALGIVLYSRPYLYLMVFEKKKIFDKSTAVICICLGTVFLILSIGIRYFLN